MTYRPGPFASRRRLLADEPFTDTDNAEVDGMTGIGSGKFAAEGILSDRMGLREGWVTAQDGRITGIGTGDCPVEPDVRGFILADTVNMHTHCADYGLSIPPGISLSDLVAPPDGLKHRYLRETPASILERDMARFGNDSRRNGSRTFADFREGGAEGCRMLRRRVPDAVILGRPLSPEFDPEEIDSILETADGIGISSISDMDRGYIERIADEVRERRMIFAIHASEGSARTSTSYSPWTPRSSSTCARPRTPTSSNAPRRRCPSSSAPHPTRTSGRPPPRREPCPWELT